MKTQELFEPSMQQYREVSSRSKYAFHFVILDRDEQLSKEDVNLIVDRIASMSGGIVIRVDEQRDVLGMDDELSYNVVLFFDTESQAHGALKVLRRVSRGKPSFTWEDPELGPPIINKVVGRR